MNCSPGCHPADSGQKEYRTMTTETSKIHPQLAAHHVRMLEQSAISPDVIQARGYRTIEYQAELKRLGFSASQLLVPTLLVPIWGVNGEIALYHHRPDSARIRNGKPAKYEFPAGSRMAI